MPTIAVERTRNGLPQSAEGATLQVLNASGTEVLAPTVVLPSAPGMYSYTIDTLGPGNYSAVWTFTNQGAPSDVIRRLFTIDVSVAIPEGVTLMAIERRMARRVGPYTTLVAAEGSSITELYTPKLHSSMNLGSYEDLFILRRGVTNDMAWIPEFNVTDRTRLVAEYQPQFGKLIVDRAWTRAPYAPQNEFVELLYLDPDQELRPSSQDGLRRCFFWDTLSITPAADSMSSSINVTNAAPWITSTSQIREASSGYPGSVPQAHPWWKARRSGADVYIQLPGAGTNTLILDVLRPVSSLVNGEMSLTGPNDDLDIVYVDPDYAAWAGIVELWKNCPERLQPLVHEQLRMSREDAASEFTKKSLVIANQMPDRHSLNYGVSDLAYQQIGNLPEPVV